jgi:DNA-binding transcriptional LysR family regulator
VPDGFAERFIIPGLAGFLALYPSVEISLVSGARHVKLVEEEFDLAIRIAETLGPSLVVRRLGVSRVIIVAAPSYLACDARPLRAFPRDIRLSPRQGGDIYGPWFSNASRRLVANEISA